MTVAVSLSLGLFVSLSCGRQALRHTGSAAQSGAEQSGAEQRSAHFTGRESSGATQIPGPSAHTLPSEDEKRRLH